MHDSKSIFRILACAVALLALGLPSSPVLLAAGGTEGHTTGICSVGAARISIPGYDGLRAQPATSTVEWTYSCRSLTRGGTVTPQLFTVRNDRGDGYAHYITDRKGDRLQYFLCVDPGCFQPIGDGPGNLNAVVHASANPSAGSSVSGTLLLYVLVPAHQRVPVGDYNDLLSVDIQY